LVVKNILLNEVYEAVCGEGGSYSSHMVFYDN